MTAECGPSVTRREVRAEQLCVGGGLGAYVHRPMQTDLLNGRSLLDPNLRIHLGGGALGFGM